MAVMLGTASAQITLDASQFMATAKQAEGAMVSLAGAGSAGKGPSIFDRLTKGALGLGTALIAPMALGLKAAVDLEQGLANVDAALGDISDADLSMLGDQFNDIAIASQYSAVQVAAVAEELAKAGFGVDELEGATQATVDLAQATGTQLPSAVGAVTQAMAVWQEGIVDSTIALTDATRVADVYTVVANNTSASVEGLSIGLRSLGPVAASLGISFNEAAAAVGLFTNFGLPAADAGLSLTRAMTDLADPTSAASQQLEELGITAFDTQGNFVGFSSLFDQLNTSMAGMSDQAKITALSAIFGAEAIDVMGLAVLTGADAYDELLAKTFEYGAAAESSAIRMDTLSAQFGTLKEGITTFLASLVSGLIPGLRVIVDFANGFVSAMQSIPGPIKTVIGAIAGLLASFAAITRSVQTFRALNGVMNAFAGNSAVAAGASRGLMAGLLRFVPVLGLVSLGFIAWKTNIFGVQDRLKAFVNGLRKFSGSFSESFRNLTADIKSFNIWGGENGVLAQGMATLPALFIAFGNALADVGGGIPILEDIGVAAIGFGESIIHITEAFTHFRDLGLDPIQAGLRALGIMFPSISAAAGTLQIVVGQATEAFRSFLAGDFAAGFESLTSAITTAIDAVDIGEVVVNIASWAKGAIADLWPYIQEWASAAVSGLASAAATIWDVLVNLGSWAKGIVSDLAPYIGMWASEAVSAVTSAAATIWDVLINVGSWAKGIVSDLAPYVAMWASEAVSGITAAAATIWDVLINVGSWAKGVVSDLGPYVVMWATEAIGGISDAAGTIWGVVVNIGSWAAGEIASFADFLSQQILGEDFTLVGDTVVAKAMSAISIAFSAGHAVGSATGGVFDIGASILGFINRQLESAISEDAFSNAGERIGNALASAVTKAVGGGAGVVGLQALGQSFATGIISAVGEEISSSGFGNQFWALFDNIGEAGGQTFEGVAEGFINGLKDAIAPDGTLDLGGMSIDIGDIDFGGELAGAFKTAFLESAIPTSTLDLGGIDVDVGEIDLGDLAGAFLEAFIQAAIPGGSITLPHLDVDVPDIGFGGDNPIFDPTTPGTTGRGFPALNPAFGVSPEAQTRPGDDIPVEPVPPAVAASYNELAQAMGRVTTAAQGARDAVGSIFGGGVGGRAAGGGGAGPDAFLGSLTAVQASLTTLTTTAQTAAANMALAGLAIGTALSNGIANGIGMAGGNVSSALSSLVGVVTGMAPSFQGAGVLVGLSGAQGIGQGLTAGSGSVRGGLASLVGVITGMAPSFRGAGILVGMGTSGGVGSGIRSASGQVGGAMASLVGIVLGYAGAMRGAGMLVGMALGQGVAAGIRSQMGAVMAAAAALVSAAQGAALKAGAINSPSKLMADTVGKQLALGVAQGIYDGLPAIYRAGSQMIPQVPVGQYANSAPYGGMTTTHTTIIHAPVNIEGNVTTEDAIIEHAAVRISDTIVRRTQQRNVALGVQS